MLRTILLFLFLTFFASVSHAETCVEIYHNAAEPLARPIRIAIPKNVVEEAKRRPGPLKIHLEVTCPGNGWTVYSPNAMVLTDGKNTFRAEPIASRNAANYGRVASGDERILTFPEFPEKFGTEASWKLVLPGGIYSWEAPRGPFSLTVYLGEKLKAMGEIDAFHRLGRVEVRPVPKDVVSYRWKFPDGTEKESVSPVLRFRCPERLAEVFTISLKAVQRDGTVLATDVQIPVKTPPVCVPANGGETLVGLCFYPSKEQKVETYVDELMDQKLGNLAVFWPNATDAKAMERMVEKLAGAGVYSMTIYQRDSQERVRRLEELGKNRYFLNNNLGEFASYLYQDEASARACGVPKCDDLLECRDWFVDRYMRRGVRGYEASYPYVFSTCGATLADYEMAGGVAYMCGELFAIGAQNLAWSSAEMRGAARKWQGDTLETRAFWGGWLAHEWQTGGIPYAAQQKFLLLKASLYQQYLMGAGAMILESGSQTTQAAAYTAGAEKKNEGYDQPTPAAYRKEMRDFYDFIQRSEPRDGTAFTPIALVRGNADAYVGTYLENSPVWGQHEIAKTDSRWRYGDPERSVAALQDVFFPLCPTAVSPYTNRWLAGNPFGQVDVVGVDEFTRLSDLTGYRLLIYSGWNTMTPPVYQLLQQYVKQGGTLVLAVPHLSCRTDREAVDYTPQDLPQTGDLSDLIDVRITGKARVGERFLADFEKIPVTDHAPVEIVESVEGKPIWIRQKRGKGSVELLLFWEYPGKTSTRPDFKRIVRLLASSFMGPVVLETSPDEEAYFSWAVYKNTVYVLNLDTTQSRFCVLRTPEGTQRLEIPPAEMRTLRVLNVHGEEK